MIPALLPDFCARYPQIQVEVSVTDRQIDLIREGVDCCASASCATFSLARRLTVTLPQVCCASPAYAGCHGAGGWTICPGTRRWSTSRRPPASRCPSSSPSMAGRDPQPCPYMVEGEQRRRLRGCLRGGLRADPGAALPRHRQLASGTLVEVLPGFRAPPLPPVGGALPGRTVTCRRGCGCSSTG